MNSQWGISLCEALTKSISFYRHRRFMALKMIKHSMVAPLFRKSTREFLPALAATGHFGSVSADVTHTKSRLATGQDRKDNNTVSSTQKILKQRVPTLRWPAINTDVWLLKFLAAQ